jgi:hypothetical protein
MNTFPPVVISTATCLHYQTILADNFTSIATYLNLTLVENFSVDVNNCLNTTMTVCGAFLSVPDVELLKEYMEAVVDGVIADLVNEYCPLTSFVSVFVMQQADNCINVAGSRACDQPSTIPSCKYVIYSRNRDGTYVRHGWHICTGVLSYLAGRGSLGVSLGLYR